MPKQLFLYSTSHCHLCELAHELVLRLPGNIVLEIIDIANNEAQLTQYAARIPVLQRQDTMTELNWPFNENDLSEFLK